MVVQTTQSEGKSFLFTVSFPEDLPWKGRRGKSVVKNCTSYRVNLRVRSGLLVLGCHPKSLCVARGRETLKDRPQKWKVVKHLVGCLVLLPILSGERVPLPLSSSFSTTKLKYLVCHRKTVLYYIQIMYRLSIRSYKEICYYHYGPGWDLVLGKAISFKSVKPCPLNLDPNSYYRIHHSSISRNVELDKLKMLT